MIYRLLAATLLALVLSSCILLVDDPSPQPVTKNPITPTVVQIAPPGVGSYTYTCKTGTVVVNYLSTNQVRVYYDGAFQTLSYSKNSPTLIYTDGKYTWEWTGKTGNLKLNNQIALEACIL